MNDVFSSCPTCGSEDIVITTGTYKSRLVCNNCPQDLSYYSQIDKIRNRDERRALIRMLLANTILADVTIHELIVLYNKTNMTQRDTDFLDKLFEMPEQKPLVIRKKKNPSDESPEKDQDQGHEK